MPDNYFAKYDTMADDGAQTNHFAKYGHAESRETALSTVAPTIDESLLGSEYQEKAAADRYYGTNGNYVLLHGKVKYEYGDGATPQYANSMNRKAVDTEKTIAEKQKELRISAGMQYQPYGAPTSKSKQISSKLGALKKQEKAKRAEIKPLLEQSRAQFEQELSVVKGQTEAQRQSIGRESALAYRGGMGIETPQTKRLYQESVALDRERMVPALKMMARNAQIFMEAGISADFQQEWDKLTIGGQWKDKIPFSPTSMLKMVEINEIYKKKLDGGKLSEGEQARLDMFASDKQLNEDVGKTVGAGIFSGVVDLLPYAVEFMATGPLAGSARSGTMRLGGKYLTKVVEGKIKKNVAGVLLSGTSAGIARTLAQPDAVIEGTIERRLNRLGYDGTEAIIRTDIEQRGLTDAIFSSFMDTFAENVSEESGRTVIAALGKVSQPVKNKLVKYGLWRTFKTLHPEGTAQKFIDGMQKFGKGGIFEEWTEERYGAFLREVLGVDVSQKDYNAEAIAKRIFGNSLNDMLVEGGVLAIAGGPATIASVLQKKQVITLGDATRIRKQNTDDDIVRMANEGTIGPLEAEFALNPTEETYDLYREAKLSGVEEEINTIMEEATKKAEEADQKPQASFVVDNEAAIDEPITAKNATELDVIGISRRENDVFRNFLNESPLPEADHIGWAKSRQDAINEGIVDDVDLIAQELKPNTERKLNEKEVAAFTIRKAQIYNKIVDLNAERDLAEEIGDMEEFSRITEEINAAKNLGLTLTETVAKSAEKTARSLAAMNMFIDRQSYDLVTVTHELKTAKGGTLTAEEEAGAEKLVNELFALEKEGKAVEQQAQEASDEEARAIAEGIISDTIKQKKARISKEKAEKLRSDAFEQLRQLGLRVNDISGLPIEVASIIKDIAFSYVNEGVTSLDQIVSNITEKLPDASPRNIYDSISGRGARAVKNVEKRAKNQIAEIKQQALLSSKIIDAMNGIIDKKKLGEPISDEVRSLKKQLELYSANIAQNEYDSELAERKIQKANEIREMVDEMYRPIKVSRTKSSELKAAESKLSEARAELNAQDKIFILEDLLANNTVQKRLERPKSNEGRRLALMRVRIEQLKQQLDAKNIDSKLARLTDEVENFIRYIEDNKPKPKAKSRNEEIAALEKAKRDQDKIADLLEALRSKTMPERIAKKFRDDPNGYKAMQKNLIDEMRSQVWYQEAMQDINELKSLERSREELAELDRILSTGDYGAFITPTERRAVKSKELAVNRLKIYQKKREIREFIDMARPKTVADKIAQIYNIPRTMKLTMDLGHLLRQGGFYMFSGRINPFRIAGQSINALVSEDKADALQMMIEEDPHYKNGNALLAKLHILHEGQKLTDRELIVSNDIMMRAPIVGKYLIKPSERSQRVGTNLIRMGIFSGMLERHPNMELDEQRVLADVINIMTGYGTGKATSTFAPYLNWLLTSTRFTSSRIQAPFQLLRQDVWKYKNVRNMLLRDSFWFLATRWGLLYFASLLVPDWEFGKTPGSSTYGKLMVDIGGGKTRVYDAWAGMQQMTKFLHDVATGDEPFLPAFFEFLEKKATPSITATEGIVFGKDWMWNDIPRTEALWRSFTPILLEGLIDSEIDETGAFDGVASSVLDALGINSYTIDTEKLEKSIENQEKLNTTRKERREMALEEQTN